MRDRAQLVFEMEDVAMFDGAQSSEDESEVGERSATTVQGSRIGQSS